MEKRFIYNYSLILKNLVQYLPSRGIMILNSFFIIPLLTHILNTKEVSIYLTVLQILNLICTLSFDWIAKAVLRFYEKYDLQDKQSRFLSTVFWLSIVVYSIVLVLYFLTKDLLTSKLAFSQFIFTLTRISVATLPTTIAISKSQCFWNIVIPTFFTIQSY